MKETIIAILLAVIIGVTGLFTLHTILTPPDFVPKHIPAFVKQESAK